MNDPVADKLLNRAKGMPNLEPPEDKSITTLYIGGNYLPTACQGSGAGPSVWANWSRLRTKLKKLLLKL